jgi:hypothetical protein
MGTNTELYDQDFFEWTETTAALLRQGKWHDVDMEACAEEIESLGNRDKRELGSRLQVLVMHLLKWCYQPSERSGSWRSTINTQRLELTVLLEQSPSLRRLVEMNLTRRYPYAREEALAETGLSEAALPQVCPWTVAQVLDEDFWPEENASHDAH